MEAARRVVERVLRAKGKRRDSKTGGEQEEDSCHDGPKYERNVEIQERGGRFA